mmetsp:Transcript_16374/g.24239  ORF Transcript_16374/g.24239 Transcript_16374/m.24239 type:complete len:118 (-) Transcript_16374:254-607(-)
MGYGVGWDVGQEERMKQELLGWRAGELAFVGLMVASELWLLSRAPWRENFLTVENVRRSAHSRSDEDNRQNWGRRGDGCKKRICRATSGIRRLVVCGVIRGLPGTARMGVVIDVRLV